MFPDIEQLPLFVEHVTVPAFDDLVIVPTDVLSPSVTVEVVLDNDIDVVSTFILCVAVLFPFASFTVTDVVPAAFGVIVKDVPDNVHVAILVLHAGDMLSVPIFVPVTDTVFALPPTYNVPTLPIEIPVALTVAVYVAVFPAFDSVTVIVAVPAATGVTIILFPDTEHVAYESFDDLQLSVPTLLDAFVFNDTVFALPPTYNVSPVLFNVNVTSFTVTVYVASFPAFPSFIVIDVLPSPIGFTVIVFPDNVHVATDALHPDLTVISP